MLKRTLILYILVLIFGNLSAIDISKMKSNLVDKNATNETKALFHNLKTLAQFQTLFGHQEATSYGHAWMGDADRSDVKDVTGSHPAMIGIDFGGLSTLNPEKVKNESAKLVRSITDTYKRGAVTTICWHFGNPVNDGSFYWDKDSIKAVIEIIPGGSLHQKYKKILDNIAAVAHASKDKNGKLIPIIFRPYHEFDGDWFWWGKSHCSKDEFISLWRFTIDYLKNEKQIRNFLYAFSPDCKFATEEEYLDRYPGDEYVDILGMDNYWDFRPDGTDNPMFAEKKLILISNLAEKKNKLAAFTETGLESLTDKNWFTETLLPILKNEKVKMAYVMVWRNASDMPTHYYAPYTGHPSSDDFVKFYKDKSILFESELPKIYDLKTVKELLKQQQAVKKVFNMVDYGAVADGKTLNTKIIQKTIDAASAKKNGGKIVFPKGTFLTGSIQMKSNVDIYLEEGAILLGSTNPDDYYPMDAEGRPHSPKNDDNSQLALFLAHKANNFTISGKGLIDGQGLALALNIDSLHHAGVNIDPNYSTHVNRPNEKVRPKLFRFSQCEQLNITDLNINNAACWGLSFELCNKLTIDNLKIINRAYWNNDGMDITDCRNVRITNCDVNSADDGICLKSYYLGYFNDSIYIANCTIRSSASAIKFGTASVGGFKNVIIENIKVYDTFRSAIAIQSVDGGIVENITIRNIEAVNTGNAIFIRLGHRAGEKPGIIRNVHIKNIKVQVPFGRPDINYDIRGPEVPYFHNPFPSSIVGIPGYLIENVVLENIKISYPGRASKGMAYVPLTRLAQVPENVKSYPEFDMFGELPAWGFYVRHVNGLTFKNVKLTLDNEDFRPAFVFDDASNVNMNQVILPEPVKNLVFLHNSKDVNFDNETISK